MRPLLHPLRTALVATAALALVAAPTSVGAHPAGQGHDKPAVVNNNHQWHLRDDHSTGVADRSFIYGSRNDSTHVMGDWNGDGERTPGVIRFHGDRDDDGRTDMVWYLRNSNTAGYADIVVSFGEVHNIERHDVPVVGDWDGDGVETIGVARHDYDNDRFLWLLKNSNESGNADMSFHYGLTGSGEPGPSGTNGVPVVGDWDGDGKTTVGINFKDWDHGLNRWILRNSNSSGDPDIDFVYGRTGDRPLTGDWDGDGTDTVGVHRLPNEWFLANRHDTTRADIHYTYGSRDMKPVIWR